MSVPIYNEYFYMTKIIPAGDRKPKTWSWI